LNNFFYNWSQVNAAFTNRQMFITILGLQDSAEIFFDSFVTILVLQQEVQH